MLLGRDFNVNSLGTKPNVRTYRTVFVSDIHLGTRHCQADLLLSFLNTFESEHLYLIGDIIDGWRLDKKWYWPDSHQKVIDTILEKGRRGTKVVYVPGNHDVFVREHAEQMLDGIEILHETTHQTSDGRRYLVVHGDQFDIILQNAMWMGYLGDVFYDACLTSNTWLNAIRARLGLEYWSLGAFAKQRVKSFVNIISSYERVVVDEVHRRDMTGVICGHIHHAENRDMNGIHYLNTGDWVESCTALAEHADGTLEVIYWPESRQGRVQHAGLQAEPL